MAAATRVARAPLGCRWASWNLFVTALRKTFNCIEAGRLMVFYAVNMLVGDGFGHVGNHISLWAFWKPQKLLIFSLLPDRHKLRNRQKKQSTIYPFSSFACVRNNRFRKNAMLLWPLRYSPNENHWTILLKWADNNSKESFLSLLPQAHSKQVLMNFLQTIKIPQYTSNFLRVYSVKCKQRWILTFQNCIKHLPSLRFVQVQSAIGKKLVMHWSIFAGARSKI